MPRGRVGCPARTHAVLRKRTKSQRAVGFMLGLGPMSLREGEVSVGGVQRRWVWWLIAGRVLAAAVVFGAGTLWSGGAVRTSEEPVRFDGTITIAIAVLALSVFYTLVLRLSRLSPRAQAD